MKIEKDKVVLFSYTLLDDQDNKIESNHAEAPMAYLHGHGNIFSSLEDALLGKQQGDSLEVVLQPDEAYGQRNPEAVQKVPVKHLVSKHKKLRPGMFVKLNTEKGVIDASVIKAGKFMVDLDLNHPLAGRSLKFDIEIKEVRNATEDELAHGHAHGDGGHHH